MAGRLNTDWFVVYVETPRRGARPHRRGGAAAPARQHREGARAGRGGGPPQGGRIPADGAPRLRALARRGRTSSSAARTSRGGGSCSAVGAAAAASTRAPGFDVHVVSFEDEEARAMTLRAKLLARPGPARARPPGVRLASRRLTLTALGKSSGAHPQGQLPQRARRAADEGGARAARQRGRSCIVAAEPAVDEGSAGDARRRFESELAVQEDNITEPGEARCHPPAARALDGVPRRPSTRSPRIRSRDRARALPRRARPACARRPRRRGRDPRAQPGRDGAQERQRCAGPRGTRT